MLTKGQIAERLEEKGVGKKNQMMRVLSALAEIAAEEVGSGEDFSIPGVARVRYGYTTPRKKGEEYVGFGGEIVKADKARPEKIRIAASAAGPLKKLLPSKGSKAYKNVVARKKR
jgi:hypothetical protein